MDPELSRCQCLYWNKMWLSNCRLLMKKRILFHWVDQISHSIHLIYAKVSFHLLDSIFLQFLLIVVATQKLLASEKYPINTFPEAAPTQNLLPLWFQAASMFDFVSLTTASVGFRPFTSADSSHTITPRSVELLSKRFVSLCQSNELTGFKCYNSVYRKDGFYLFNYLNSLPFRNISGVICLKDPDLLIVWTNRNLWAIFIPSETWNSRQYSIVLHSLHL